jgi:Protein of unknown function (DUF3592)
LVFGLFWTALVLTFDGVIVTAAVRQQLAKSFSTVTGRVTKSEVTSQRGSKGGTQYSVDIEYNYIVDGKRYHGTRFRYPDWSSSDGDWAREAVQAHPRGAQTTVYYQPGRPEESLLSPGIGGGELFMLLFLTPFNLIMFGIWAGVWEWGRSRGAVPVAGGAKITTEGTRVRVRLPRYSPWLVGLVSLGFSAFIAVFVVCFLFGGFHPALDRIIPVWVVVLAISVGVFLWCWLRVKSGAEDLVIDEAAGMVRLPQTFGRKRPVSAAIVNIASVQVEKIPHTNKGSTTYTYVPVMGLRNESIEEGKLVEFYDEQKAKAFTEWLRGRIGLPVVADEA